VLGILNLPAWILASLWLSRAGATRHCSNPPRYVAPSVWSWLGWWVPSSPCGSPSRSSTTVGGSRPGHFAVVAAPAAGTGPPTCGGPCGWVYMIRGYGAGRLEARAVFGQGWPPGSSTRVRASSLPSRS
jgi:hypothetical protein